MSARGVVEPELLSSIWSVSSFAMDEVADSVVVEVVERVGFPSLAVWEVSYESIEGKLQNSLC